MIVDAASPAKVNMQWIKCDPPRVDAVERVRGMPAERNNRINGASFTHVTARRIAQPPIGDLCHEAPTLAVARTSRSSATGSIDNSPGGILPPLMIRAFGAHCRNQTHAVQQKKLLDHRQRVAGAAKACQGQAPSRFSC